MKLSKIYRKLNKKEENIEMVDFTKLYPRFTHYDTSTTSTW